MRTSEGSYKTLPGITPNFTNCLLSFLRPQLVTTATLLHPLHKYRQLESENLHNTMEYFRSAVRNLRYRNNRVYPLWESDRSE
jgi:hypothetical protein